MVLIVPEILLDDKSQYGGSLRVSFPLDSGCEAFSVPLIPLEDKWDLCEILCNKFDTFCLYPL